MRFDKHLSRTAENVGTFHQLKGVIIIGITEGGSVIGSHGLDYATVLTLVESLKAEIKLPPTLGAVPL